MGRFVSDLRAGRISARKMLGWSLVAAIVAYGGYKECEPAVREVASHFQRETRQIRIIGLYREPPPASPRSLLQKLGDTGTVWPVPAEDMATHKAITYVNTDSLLEGKRAGDPVTPRTRRRVRGAELRQL